MAAFRSINFLALVLGLCVVVFGAYVRLSDAGLGCPDWPGCYGHVGVPDASHEIATADAKFPERPVEAPKAWKEMIHRYLASTLGLLIVALAVLSLRIRHPRMPRRLPWLLVALVMFQGALGMWTVTLLLKPLVVTGHLVGGLATISLLLWMWLGSRESGVGTRDAERGAPPGLRGLVTVSLLAVCAQIFLGGWTSTNYAALACPDFPTCHGRWLPETDVREAYTLWRGLGINYEHGVLDNRARVTIHFFHRVGAILVTGVLAALGLLLLVRGRTRFWQGFGIAVLTALAVQIGIGISTVLLQLPLLLAAAHNAGAAILLLTLVSLNYFVRSFDTQ